MFNSADGINETDTFAANVGVCAHQSMVFSKPYIGLVLTYQVSLLQTEKRLEVRSLIT